MTEAAPILDDPILDSPILDDPILNDNDETGAQKVFVRLITARPGPPWDQARQAGLEARLGAPAPLSEVVYRLRRLDSWRPGGSARFAAVYARLQDARQGLVATPTIDGKRIPVSFMPAAEAARRLRKLAIVALASGAIAALAVTALGSAMARRSQDEAALRGAERLATSRQRQAQELRRLKRQSLVLDQMGLRKMALGDVLSDLAWASSARSPDAHIQALHWDHGYLAVEVEGEAAPFLGGDRPDGRPGLFRRPGVWLWGVSTLEPWAAGPGVTPGSSRPGAAP